jgi:triosephosphate isomerase
MANAEGRPLVVGNWKMNGLRKSSSELLRILQDSVRLPRHLDVVVCPPATLIANFAGLARGSRVRIGAQDCHPEPAGAYTGDVSAEMLADAGATMVILGHSERRSYHKETDAQVRVKTLAAWRAGLTAIVCVGETRAERESRQTLDVVARQLSASLPEGARGESLVIAYEPVWAIGTGLTPTTNDVAEVHNLIRRKLIERYRGAGEGMRLLYGGSVKPSNAEELMRVENVDGALVGGASLKADEFIGIANGYRQLAA